MMSPCLPVIKGSTDSETLFCSDNQQRIATNPTATRMVALQNRIARRISAPSSSKSLCEYDLDGDRFNCPRFCYWYRGPSLYWLWDDPTYPGAVIIAGTFYLQAIASFPEQKYFSVGVLRSKINPIQL